MKILYQYEVTNIKTGVTIAQTNTRREARLQKNNFHIATGRPRRHAVIVQTKIQVIR